VVRLRRFAAADIRDGDSVSHVGLVTVGDVREVVGLLTALESALAEAKGRVEQQDAEYLRIAEALGTVHEQSMGPLLPGRIGEVIADIDGLKDKAAKAEISAAKAWASLREVKHGSGMPLDCGQDGVCATPPGCMRHWEERNRELASKLRHWEHHPVENTNKLLREANNRQTERVVAAEKRVAELEAAAARHEQDFQAFTESLTPWEGIASKRAERIAELEKGLSNCLEHELTRAILREVPAPRKRGRR
jgi:uncharacterized coiled-coil protein SlyX